MSQAPNSLRDLRGAGPAGSWAFENASVAAPLRAIARSPQDAVLAIITGTIGPSYRKVGATMAFLPDGARVGLLSSGCIEADLALHAAAALGDGLPRQVRYGAGSPFMDIQLPCGGGLEILLVPRPDPAPLRRVIAEFDARRPATLAIDRDSGRLFCLAGDLTRSPRPADPDRFLIGLTPEARFLIFGKGPETTTLAALVNAAHFPLAVISPDPETLDNCEAPDAQIVRLARPELPREVAVDPWSAVILLFHDHEWEPPILAQALATPAFYVGAMGSRRAGEARIAALRALDTPQASLDRLRGPIGLLPSVRDPRMLAVSILAEVLALSQHPGPATP